MTQGLEHHVDDLVLQRTVDVSDVVESRAAAVVSNAQITDGEVSKEGTHENWLFLYIDFQYFLTKAKCLYVLWLQWDSQQFLHHFHRSMLPWKGCRCALKQVNISNRKHQAVTPLVFVTSTSTPAAWIKCDQIKCHCNKKQKQCCQPRLNGLTFCASFVWCW